MGEVKSYYTAEQARARMLESQVLKNHIYKEIRECANEQRYRTRWTFWDVTPEIRSSILKDLEADGYTVEVDPEVEIVDDFTYAIIISW